MLQNSAYSTVHRRTGEHIIILPVATCVLSVAHVECPTVLLFAIAIFVVVDYIFFIADASIVAAVFSRVLLSLTDIGWNRIDHTNHALATFAESKNRSSFCAIYV